jgi:hypothetical protein
MKPWVLQMKIRAEQSEIEELSGWIRGEGGAVTASDPNEAGVQDVKVEGPISQAKDIEFAISKWSLEHPDAIFSPEDFMPRN